MSDSYSGWTEAGRPERLDFNAVGPHSCLFCLDSDWTRAYRITTPANMSPQIAIPPFVVACEECSAEIDAEDRARLLAKLSSTYGELVASAVWERFTGASLVDHR